MLVRAEKECDHAVLYWVLVAAANLAKLRPDSRSQVSEVLEHHASGSSQLARRGAFEGLAVLQHLRSKGEGA